MTALVVALLLMLVAVGALVVDVRYAIRACRTTATPEPPLLPRPVSVDPHPHPGIGAGGNRPIPKHPDSR
jgi:hypothetical protein